MRPPDAIPAANRGRPANGARRIRRWALVGTLAVAIALGLRAGFGAMDVADATVGTGEPALSVEMSARPPEARAGRLAAVETVGPADLPPAAAREPATADGAASDPATTDADFAIQFLREEGMSPAAALRVRLTPLAGEPGSTYEARTDANGLLAIPQATGLRRFALRLGGDGGPELTPEPARLERPARIAEDLRPIVRVHGAVARVTAVALDASGRPAQGTSVEFELLPVSGTPASAPISCSLRDAPTARIAVDEDGLATLDLFDPASLQAALRARIVQQTGSPWISSEAKFAPPLVDVRFELALSRAATLAVRVEDHAGTALAERMVRLRGLEASRAPLGIASDAQGRVEFDGLAAGSYVVEFEDSTSGTRAQATLRLNASERREWVLTLPAPELPLAVAGRLVAHAGANLQGARVTVRVDGREEAQLVVDGEGRFAYHRAPCERLRVGVAIDSRRAEASPGVLDVPFGTGDLEFTIEPAQPAAREILRLVDAQSRSPVLGASVRTIRDADVERIDGYVASIVAQPERPLASYESGVYEFVTPQAADARVWIDSPTHRRVELDRAALAGLPKLDGIPTLAVERGHVRRWLLLDAATGERVVGATVVIGHDAFLEHREAQGGRAIAGAVSDARGRLEAVLSQPPRRWAILAPGYRSHAIELDASWIEVVRLER